MPVIPSVLALLAATLVMLGFNKPEPRKDQESVHAARCSFTLKGKPLVSGDCFYSYSVHTYDSGYRSELLVLYEGRQINFPSLFFYLRNPSELFSRDSTWNKDPAFDHAHTPLGKLRRHGSCWFNRDVTLCISPDRSQSCVWNEKMDAPHCTPIAMREARRQ